MTGVKGTGKGAGEKLGNAFGEVAGNLMVPMKQIHDAYRQLNKKGRTSAKKKASGRKKK